MLGKREQQEAEELKEKKFGLGSSDGKGYTGGAEREGEALLVAFFSSDRVSSNFLLISCKEVTLSFPVLEAPRYQNIPLNLFDIMIGSFFFFFPNCAHKNINFGVIKSTPVWPF